jgi:predicted RNase H-like HicB family nuclease
MAIRHYYALIESLGGGKGFSIWFPSFRGTTSHADTQHDVPRQAADALATIVEAMEADGEALPTCYEDNDGGVTFDAGFLKNSVPLLVPVEIAGKALRVNVSLNEGLLNRIDEVARRTGTSRSALLARGAKLVIAAENAA